MDGCQEFALGSTKLLLAQLLALKHKIVHYSKKLQFKYEIFDD